MNKFKIIMLGLFLTTILSCNDNETISVVNTSTNSRDEDYLLKLGTKLENPYSVTNMKKALEIVKSQISTSKFAKSQADFEIETSHLYVKIEPKTEQEEALLKKDSTQILSDYPLDYEFSPEVLKEVGTNDVKKISTYYVAVPTNYVFPAGIKTEVLEELYIPEQDPYFENISETGRISKSSIASKEDLLGNLLIASYTLTNNKKQLGIDDQATSKTAWWIFGKRWRPSGRITMYDNSLNREVPVEGAQVLIRQWFTVDSGITDGNGYFSTGTVRGQARYVLQWERQHYDIRNDWFGQAETSGPYRKDESWNYSVSGDENVQYAMIHRAAHHYFYKDIKDLRRPPLYGDMPTRMKIASIDRVNNDLNGDFSFWRGLGGVLPTMRIYKRTFCDEYYGTVIHELAHSSHWKMAWWTFQSVDDKVAESWARGVQWELTRMVYPNYNRDLPNLPKYTLIVRDLIDNDGLYEKRGVYGEFTSGYTISQIESSLKYQKTWNDWKNKIKEDYENPTENNLDTVFDYWNNAQ
jgi:hypothetical protein